MSLVPSQWFLDRRGDGCDQGHSCSRTEIRGGTHLVSEHHLAASIASAARLVGWSSRRGLHPALRDEQFGARRLTRGEALTIPGSSSGHDRGDGARLDRGGLVMVPYSVCHCVLTPHLPSQRNIPVRAGGHDAVDDLPTWVRWIIVFAVGLSPILTFWIASVLGRFRRRKLWSRAQSGAAEVADRQASRRENEAVDRRTDGAH
jgi:hypothetical protein